MPSTSAMTAACVCPVTAWYMLIKLVASGRAGSAYASPGNESVLHFLILRAISAGLSSSWMRESSDSARAHAHAMSGADEAQAGMHAVAMSGKLREASRAAPAAGWLAGRLAGPAG
jgi:hypothetical protein